MQQLPLPRRERDKLASIVSSANFDGWLNWYLIFHKFHNRRRKEDILSASQSDRFSSKLDHFEDLRYDSKDYSLLFGGSSTLV